MLDLPHLWSAWTQRTLVSADEILIVGGARPCHLRKRQNLFDFLRASRVNDRRPFYCLNLVGVPKRPEIKPADFAKAVEDQPIAVIPFDPQAFGTAANNGQMIARCRPTTAPPRRSGRWRKSSPAARRSRKTKGGLFSPLLGKFTKR